MTSLPHFFGYGSLVNERTHSYPQVQNATLQGWRRVWQHTKHRPVAYLTVMPCANTTLHGIVAQVPNADWAALDKREAAYLRKDVSPHIIADTPPPETAVYTIPDGQHTNPTAKHPILLSYLDVVVQGYLNRFGAHGVNHFFETTDGWSAPILDDRAAARYPRAQDLSSKETALVDGWLSRLSAQVK